MPKMQNNSEKWVFLDNLDQNKIIEYVEEKTLKSKAGHDFEVCYFLSDGDKNEYKVTSFNIENMNELVDKYGKDDKLWAGKKFKIEKGERKDFKLVEVIF